MNISYNNHDVDRPGLSVGMALPTQDQLEEGTMEQLSIRTLSQMVI